MKAFLIRFWQWLYPERVSEFATCKVCGDTGYKIRMVHMAGYGWYCNEEEVTEDWNAHQW